MIKAIVLDMDDTLYHEIDYIFSGFNYLDNWIKTNYKVEGFYKTAIEIFNLGERKLIFNKTLDKLNVQYDYLLIKQMINEYRGHMPTIELCEDAVWLFNSINKDVRLGLISDGYLETQQNKVSALGIRESINTIILSDAFGREHWKPSIIPYVAACNKMQLNHNECVYIGDNENKDFISAKMLGWTTIQIQRENGIYNDIELNEDYCAHYRISSLKELAEFPFIKHLFVS